MKTIASLLAYAILSAVAAFGIGCMAALIPWGMGQEALVVNTVGYTVAALAWLVLLACRNVQLREFAKAALDLAARLAFLAFILG